jgi:hypothetical protein
MEITLNLITFVPLGQKLWNDKSSNCLLKGFLVVPKANQGPHGFGGLQHGDIKELLSWQIEWQLNTCDEVEVVQ